MYTIVFAMYPEFLYSIHFSSKNSHFYKAVYIAKSGPTSSEFSKGQKK